MDWCVSESESFCHKPYRTRDSGVECWDETACKLEFGSSSSTYLQGNPTWGLNARESKSQLSTYKAAMNSNKDTIVVIRSAWSTQIHSHVHDTSLLSTV